MPVLFYSFALGSVSKVADVENEILSTLVSLDIMHVQESCQEVMAIYTPQLTSNHIKIGMKNIEHELKQNG